MGILATYKAYRDYEPQYKDWNNSQNIDDSKREKLNKNNVSYDKKNADMAQKNAKVVADTVLLLDNYAQTKAEDVETVFQTLQLYLIMGLTAVTGAPIVIPKLSSLLDKKPGKVKLLDGLNNALKKYDKATVNIAKKNLPLKNVCSAIIAIPSILLFAKAVKTAVTNQVDATRRAKFEGMNKDYSNIKDFAVLTDQQEKEVQEIINKSKESKSEDPDQKKLNDLFTNFYNRINVSKSIHCVNDLLKDKNSYFNDKKKYDNSLNEMESYYNNPICSDEVAVAKADNQLFQSMIKKVDVDSQDDITRIEQVINVGYSALFAGGYLELLLTEKLVKDALKIKNPIVALVTKVAVPLITYLIINKNLANFQNSAIKTVRFNKTLDFANDPDNFRTYSQDQLNTVQDSSVTLNNKKHESLPKFLKRIFKEVKEYKSNQNTVLEDKKRYIDAKRHINLTPEQEQNAKHLQRNAFMSINKIDDNNQKYAECLETMSELALAPLEAFPIILGTILGKNAEKKATQNAEKKAIQNSTKEIIEKAVNSDIKSSLNGFFKKVLKYVFIEAEDAGKGGAYKVVGAIIGFIPVALTEIYTTAQQRHALRIAGMLASKDLEDYKKYVNYDNKSFKQQIAFAFNAKFTPTPFIAFQKKFNKD